MGNVYYKNCSCQGCYNWRVKFTHKKKRKLPMFKIAIFWFIIGFLLMSVYLETRSTNENYLSDSFSSLYNLQNTTIIS
jgi:hypothetical protein